MDISNIQNILNYYIEYEMYNIISSSNIKVNNKTSIIMKDIPEEKVISEMLNRLKEEKSRERIEKFIGKRVNNPK